MGPQEMTLAGFVGLNLMIQLHLHPGCGQGSGGDSTVVDAYLGLCRGDQGFQEQPVSGSV